jgi:PKD domain
VKRANLSKYPVLILLILGAAAVWPAAASALVAPTTGGGRVGYLPLNQTGGTGGASAPAVHATEPTGFPPLEYHGGPVMHSQEAFAIFWAPSGYGFPAGYEEAIETYLEDVAADSGKPSNVYSVSAQYFDETEQHAWYEDSYGGSFGDGDSYGTTCPAYNGFSGAEFTACVTDQKLREEVASVVEAEGLPHGLGVEYYMVLPPEVGSCFEEGLGEFFCFDANEEEVEPEGFCAYHSFIEEAELVYANISYSPQDPIGCGVGEYPNGNANGNADDTFSSLSHEANESITDPTLEAWFDEEGFENGDECRNSSDDYGPALGGSAGKLFNQAIGADHYYLQQEWSNDIEDCAQRVRPAQPVVSGPASATVGQAVDFNAFSSVPGDGGIGFYSWELGDGFEEEGEEAEEVVHSYSSPGTYTVTLTVYDDGGFAYSKSKQITVKAPEEPPSGGGSGGGGGGGTGTSSGSSSSSSSSSGASSGPAPVPAPGIALAAAKAKVKNGVVAIKLTCHGGPCSGVVKLLDHGAIGHAAFHLAAGAKTVVKVRLTARGLVLLAKKPGGLKVFLTGSGLHHQTVTLSS